MRRRGVLLGGMAVLACGVAGTATATYRWHVAPRREPGLTDAHLARLRALPPGAGPRVLFVGNSMMLRHDLPGAVSARAAAAGHPLQVALAAARGARLAETWRIEAFRAVLESGWDILVLQDFSTTCLRAPDRWGSARAMRAMAQAARCRAVLLFPTWAFPLRHSVYQSGAGLLSRPPEDPAAFARCITAHYAGIAQAEGWARAPVTEALQPDATPWLEEDLHHPNPAGSELIADVLWQSLAPMLA